MELFLPHGPFGGRVASIASKSQLQRLLLCAALADRETVVHGASDAADVQAMCRCLRALCAQEQIRELSKLLDLGEQSFDTFRMDYYTR